MNAGADSAKLSNTAAKKQSDIAIVGMSCIYPNAQGLLAFWKTVVRGIDCTRMVQDDEWAQGYYNRQSTSFDQAYCGRGGFVQDIEFDPPKYGVMPNSVNGADTDQFAALKAACDALADAGYDRSTFNGEKAEVLIGRIGAPGNGVMNMIQRGTTMKQFIDVLKKLHPEYTPDDLKEISEAMERSLRPCNSDTIPGVMPNIMAGRIAGRLGFKGRSMVIDAACASSLIALEIGVRDLQSGMCDLVLAGGVHMNSLAVFYQMFCGLGALSRREIISPFDNEADGTMLGDGIGMVVLKRYDEAIAANDRIYAVIKGIGTSSDGMGTSMLAPSWEGEALAMQRAYDMAQISPRTVGLLEAHGTATPTGDVTEMMAVQKIFKADEHNQQWCAIGSVKSNFGHTQAAAGVAGVIKAALALYQKILPPTLNVTTPNKQIDWKNSPCYINQRARIWIHPQVHAKVDRERYPELSYDTPARRAAVSAFGFGGVNAHVVLEEHRDAEENQRASVFPDWDNEVFLFAADEKEQLLERLAEIEAYTTTATTASLKDLAFTLNGEYSEREKAAGANADRLKAAIVATAISDLALKLRLAISHIEKGNAFKENGASPLHPDIYFSGSPAARAGKLAFVLPGLGAAYPNMLADLSAHFPDVRAVFDFVDQLALASGASELPSEKIFPNPFKFESGKSSTSLLANEDSAVIMLLMAEWALYTVLEELGIKADALVGVSTGEFAVLNMAGAADVLQSAPLFYKFSTAVARAVPQEGLADLRTLKIDAGGERVEALLKKIEPPVYLAAALSPQQSLVSGDKAAIAQAQKILQAEQLTFNMLPTAIPYHTPLVAGHVKADNEELNKLPLSAPKIESWSCSSAQQYPSDLNKLREITTNLFTRPIRLQATIEKLYERGVTKFVEVGPKGVMTSVIDEILACKPHLAVASNKSIGSAIGQLHHMIAALACHDTKIDLDYLYHRRAPKKLDLGALPPARSRSTINLRMVFPFIDVDAETVSKLRARSHTSAALPQHEGHEHSPFGYGAEESLVKPGKAMNRCELLNSGLYSFNEDEHSVQACINLNVLDHQYLVDHAIGGAVSTAYGTERVFLLPLTVALELMAEAASFLAPGKVVAKMEHIRALRRIKVGLSGTRIAVTASTSDRMSGKFSATIAIIQDDGMATAETDGTVSGAEPVTAMSCDIIFQDQYPQAPRLEVNAVVKEGRAPTLSPPLLYTQETMFHGPRMQSVVELTRVDKKQILGTVLARDAIGWLPNSTNPQFIGNPLLLDNATQLVLFHLYEHKQPANALLPFLVDSLEFYSDLSSLRGQISVFANLTSLTNRGTEADVTLLTAEGFVLAKFNTICSRRIALEEPWRTAIYDPLNTTLSGREASAILDLVPQSPLWAAAAFAAGDLPADDVTLTWLMDYVFSQQEQRYCELSFKNGRRRREWLLGRLAAKQAVRNLLMALTGAAIGPADIQVFQDESGKPWIGGEFVSQLGWAPIVSLSHKEGSVVAIAAHPQIGSSIGIDLEDAAAREEGFEQLAFTDMEQHLLRRTDDNARRLLMAALWSAKEAAAKASGIGLRNNPKSIQIYPALDEQSLPCFGPLWHAEILNLDGAENVILPVILQAKEGHVLALSCWTPVSREHLQVANTF